jgi:hypothetical protein
MKVTETEHGMTRTTNVEQVYQISLDKENKPHSQ